MTIKNVSIRVEVETEDAKYLLSVPASLVWNQSGSEKVWILSQAHVELALKKFKQEAITKTEVTP